MANKKLAVALCLGLVSNVALSNVQALAVVKKFVTSPAGHVTQATLGVGMTAFFGSPLVRDFLNKSVEKTYLQRVVSALEKRKVCLPGPVVLALAVAGTVGGVVALAYSVNEIRKDLQQKGTTPVTKPS